MVIAAIGIGSLVAVLLAVGLSLVFFRVVEPHTTVSNDDEPRVTS